MLGFEFAMNGKVQKNQKAQQAQEELAIAKHQRELIIDSTMYGNEIDSSEYDNGNCEKTNFEYNNGYDIFEKTEWVNGINDTNYDNENGIGINYMDETDLNIGYDNNYKSVDYGYGKLTKNDLLVESLKSTKSTAGLDKLDGAPAAGRDFAGAPQPLIFDSHNIAGEGERFQDICASMTATQFNELNNRDGGGGYYSNTNAGGAEAYDDYGNRMNGERVAAHNTIAGAAVSTPVTCESLFRVRASRAVAPVVADELSSQSRVWTTNSTGVTPTNHPDSNHFGPPHSQSIRGAWRTDTTTRSTTHPTKQKCLFKRVFGEFECGVQSPYDQQQQQHISRAAASLMCRVMPAQTGKRCSIEASASERGWGGGYANGGPQSIIIGSEKGDEESNSASASPLAPRIVQTLPSVSSASSSGSSTPSSKSLASVSGRSSPLSSVSHSASPFCSSLALIPSSTASGPYSSLGSFPTVSASGLLSTASRPISSSKLSLTALGPSSTASRLSSSSGPSFITSGPSSSLGSSPSSESASSSSASIEHFVVPPINQRAKKYSLCVLSLEALAERKKQQNRIAAQRYRNRRTQTLKEGRQEIAALTARNVAMRAEERKLVTKIARLKASLGLAVI